MVTELLERVTAAAAAALFLLAKSLYLQGFDVVLLLVIIVILWYNKHKRFYINNRHKAFYKITGNMKNEQPNRGGVQHERTGKRNAQSL